MCEGPSQRACAALSTLSTGSGLSSSTSAAFFFHPRAPPASMMHVSSHSCVCIALEPWPGNLGRSAHETPASLRSIPGKVESPSVYLHHGELTTLQGSDFHGRQSSELQLPLCIWAKSSISPKPQHSQLCSGMTVIVLSYDQSGF